MSEYIHRNIPKCALCCAVTQSNNWNDVMYGNISSIYSFWYFVSFFIIVVIYQHIDRHQIFTQYVRIKGHSRGKVGSRHYCNVCFHVTSCTRMTSFTWLWGRYSCRGAYPLLTFLHWAEITRLWIYRSCLSWTFFPRSSLTSFSKKKMVSFIYYTYHHVICFYIWNIMVPSFCRLMTCLPHIVTSQPFRIHSANSYLSFPFIVLHLLVYPVYSVLCLAWTVIFVSGLVRYNWFHSGIASSFQGNPWQSSPSFSHKAQPISPCQPRRVCHSCMRLWHCWLKCCMVDVRWHVWWRSFDCHKRFLVSAVHSDHRIWIGTQYKESWSFLFHRSLIITCWFLFWFAVTI